MRNLPYARNPIFTGREELLERLSAALLSDSEVAITQPQAISGLGGIGKTQLAVEYAYRHSSEYDTILWCIAENRETLISGYVTIATLLHLPEKDERDQQLTIEAVKRWLSNQPRWLLILDNADELALVRDFLPPNPRGYVLLTTRARSGGSVAHMLEVDILSPDLGALLLLRRANILQATDPLEQAPEAERMLARTLSKELGGLPLALDQAGAYIEETQCGLAAYQQLYRSHRAALLKERGNLIHNHPEPVATTWSLSFQKVEEKQAGAADLLRLCAFLAPENIPEDMLIEGAEHLPDTLRTLVSDPFTFNQAMKALLAYSLVRRDGGAKTLAVHRLVQAVLQDSMSEQEAREWAEWAVAIVNQAFPYVEFERWTQCEWLLPHAQQCADWIKQYHFMSPEASSLLNQTGYYLYVRGRYAEAEPLWQRALTIREQQLGPTHSRTALSLNNLAGLYYTQGKYAQVEPLYQRALAINKQQLGTEHPDTATSMNNLAALYKEQGKYDLAEPLYQRALTICEQQLGPEHPDTARSLNNLAELYRDQGKHTEAETLYKRALGICEQQLGPEHPDTAHSLNNLALLYDAQGKYDQAEHLYQRALTIRERLLGPKHPDTAISLNNLALLYHVQGQYAQAEFLLQRALAIREQQLGPTHPDTAQSLSSLALLYHMQGKYDEAEPLYQRALAIYEKQLGEKHSTTQTIAENYAILQWQMSQEGGEASSSSQKSVGAFGKRKKGKRRR